GCQPAGAHRNSRLQGERPPEGKGRQVNRYKTSASSRGGPFLSGICGNDRGATAMNRKEVMEEYTRAQKRGQKEYREAMAEGRYPYLPVLDDILENADVESQLPMGLVEIPLDQVVGTKTAGRTAAFA